MSCLEASFLSARRLEDLVSPHCFRGQTPLCSFMSFDFMFMTFYWGASQRILFMLFIDGLNQRFSKDFRFYEMF